MIVNRRTRNGSFGNADGTFMVKALRTDTLLIGAGLVVGALLKHRRRP